MTRVNLHEEIAKLLGSQMYHNTMIPVSRLVGWYVLLADAQRYVKDTASSLEIQQVLDDMAEKLAKLSDREDYAKEHIFNR